MAALAFDTHAFVKRLTAAGMPEAQAEVLVDEQSRLIDSRLTATVERLATKEDIRTLRSETKEDIRTLRSETKADIQAFRSELRTVETTLELKIELAKRDTIIRMGAIGALGVTFLSAIRFFGH
ncbi:MAG: coiled-coil domain-containing protein [Rhodospirillaceae bacterium]